MNIAVENSTWNNIGDGFYQFSIYFAFKKLFPSANITMLDGPISRAFRPGKNADNVFRLIDIQDADVVILSGPILGEPFIEEYGPLIRALSARGKAYCILSACATQANLSENLDFFKKYPPIAFSSRDSPTFALYRRISKNCWDGVCAASLISLTCDVTDVVPKIPYVTVSYYETYEPSKKYIEKVIKGEAIEEISVERNRNWKFVRHIEYLRSAASEIAGHIVVRPHHDITYKFGHLNFGKPNSFLSFNPLSYLSLYKHTALTFTNRIHAALPTLSFGKPAIYHGTEARNAVFNRLGFDNCKSKVLQLDREIIQAEFKNLADFLRSIEWPNN